MSRDKNGKRSDYSKVDKNSAADVEMVMGKQGAFKATEPTEPPQYNDALLQDQVGEVCLISHSPYWIFKVAGRGDLKEVKRLLGKNEKTPLLCDQKGLTPLHHAARGNHVEIVEYILDHGANVNVKDNEGNTPLHTAVAASACDCISLLLHSGADSTIINERNLAPIHLSIVRDTPLSLTTMIADQSVDINLAGERGFSPLHYAAKFDRSECALILLKSGSKLCGVDNNGSYPIHTAAYHASAKTLQQFIKHTFTMCGITKEHVLSLKDSDNHTPLHAAVNSADIKAMRVCLEAGALVDAQQDDRSTPVHYACSQGNAQMVEVMLELQKDRMKSAIQLRDGMGMTPLHRASIFDHVDVVILLIDNGADINSQDSQQRSPILVAASKGSWNTVYLLIERGADVTLRDKNNRNFIHIAIQSGISLQDLDFRTNLDLRSQLNETDIYGCTPLHYASKEGFLHVIDDLIRFGASVNAKNHANESPFHFAAKYGRYNTCKRLLDSKLGPHVVNEKDGLGRTSVHIAAKNGHAKIVSLLLQRGCSMIRCFHGNTALHQASINGYTQCMRYILVVHGNLINAINKEGDTALHVAAKEGKSSAVTLLLSRGALMPTNNEGNTFFDNIVANRHEEVAKAVIKHDRWKEVMDTVSVQGVPMFGLIEHLPSVCLDVLDRCQTFSNHERHDRHFTVTFLFKYLQYRGFEDCLKQKYPDDYIPMKAMNTMVKHSRVDCLSHPVCINYVQRKWNAYGVWLHMSNLIVYCLFLALLTWFVVVYRLPEDHPTFNSTGTYNVTDAPTILTNDKERSTFANVILYILISYVVLNVIKEFVQMWQQRERYLVDISNLLEWTLYISTAVFIIPFLIDKCGSYQWEAAAIAVFLAWFNLLLLLQRFDLFGIYIVMFLEILTTLIHVVCVFSILIIAFGLAFFILMADSHDSKAHIYPGMSMIRVTMMMLELDYMSSFNDPFNDNDPTTLPFSNLSLALLILFVLLMPILLMNLMIGLAVGDIESVQRNARLKRLAMQVEMHTDLESKLPRRFLDKVEKAEYVCSPNCGKNALILLLMRVTSGLHDNNTKSDVINSRTHQELRDDLAKQKTRLKDMSNVLEKQYDLLRLIVQKMEIKSEDDFLDEGASCTDANIDRVKPPSMWSLATVQADVVTGAKVLSRWKRSMKKDDNTDDETAM